jgi:putative FmdB family regulatory protein
MPKLDDYQCLNCNSSFEFMSMQADEKVECPHCGSPAAEKRVTGGHVFDTIVATSLTSKKHKAGYVHNYANKPAEKISVSVPRNKGASS